MYLWVCQGSRRQPLDYHFTFLKHEGPEANHQTLTLHQQQQQHLPWKTTAFHFLKKFSLRGRKRRGIQEPESAHTSIKKDKRVDE